METPQSGKPAKLRLLFFIESLSCGGAEKSLVSLLQLLDYDRVDVDLMMVNTTGGEFLPYVPSQVRVISMPSPRGWRRAIAPVCQAAYAAVWRAHTLLGVRRHKAETLWHWTAPSMQPLYGRYDVAIAYQQGLPTYYVASRVDARKRLAWINIDLEGAGYRERFNRPYYDRYDGLVAVSAQLYQRLRESAYVDPDRLTTIYDILNVDLIRRMGTEIIKTGFPADRDVLRVVTVGRLSAQKNYPLAVETAAELMRRGLRFHWIFVGDGPARAEVEAKIGECQAGDVVSLAGVQPNPYPYMAAADIYVHTASYEGFGLTLTEARILGRPVVTTDFSVVRDQIVDGVNGLIVKQDPVSVADGIMRLATDPALRQSIEANIAAETNTTAQTEVEKFYSLINLWPSRITILGPGCPST